MKSASEATNACIKSASANNNVHNADLLNVQVEHSLLQVTHTSMDELGAAAAGAWCKVKLLHQSCFKTWKHTFIININRSINLNSWMMQAL